jgi:TolA-binding protein
VPKYVEERTFLKKFLLIAVGIVCGVAAIYFWIHSTGERELNSSVAGEEAPIIPEHLKKISPAPTTGAGHLTDPQSDALFQAAIKDYDKHSYAGASDGFYKASAIDPSAPAPHFYLGVCYLLTNDVGASITELHLTAMLGGKTYEERAHYYLAQAFWRQHESKRAEQELDTIIVAGGSMKKDAEILKGEMYVVDGQTR